MLIKLLECDRSPETPVSVLGVVVVLIALLQMMSCQFTCRPVEIGRQVNFTCNCPSDENSRVDWTLDGELKSHRCDRNYQNPGSRLVVTYDEQRRTSTLSINAINVADSKRYVRCVPSAPDRSQAGPPVAECMLQPYLKPSSVTCGAVQVRHRTIRFGCTAGQVYPELDCSVTYRERLSESRKNLEHDANWIRRKTALPSGYFNASCYVDIVDIPSGTYEFFGAIKPALLTRMRDTVVPVPPTGIIHVSNSTTKVYLRRTTQINQTELCAEAEHVVSFRCDAEGFFQAPLFTWMVDLTHTKIDGHVIKDGSSYFSIFSVLANVTHNRSKIYCVVKDVDFGNVTIETIDIGIQWLQPSTVSVFIKSQSEADKSQSTFHFYENQNVSFTCSVSDPRTFKSKIRAHCVHGNVSLTNREMDGAMISVTVPISTEYRSVKCNCSAIHTFGCSVTSKRFELNLKHANESGAKKDHIILDPENRTHFYILLGCACALFMTVLSYAFFRLCRRRKSICCRSEQPLDHYENIMPPNTNGVCHYPRSEIKRLTAEDNAPRDCAPNDLYVNHHHIQDYLHNPDSRWRN
ncbi:hypothetical protein Btru_072041 [Bulinus truncatus]|nr:hypothetical protein Btru_072041 [Bulinus truncatus]